MPPDYDAIIVGAGPNGLSAGIKLAQAGCSVLLVEARDTIGGGTRSAELTLPGFIHDICSAIHPLSQASPFFQNLPLCEYGLEWIQPPKPLAHPLDDGSAVVLHQDLEAMVPELGEDGPNYRKLFSPFVEDWQTLTTDLLGPLRFPQNPIGFARFGLQVLRSVDGLARAAFRSPQARALFAGLGAHSIMPLEKPGTAAFGLTLGILAHAVGWPLARGGSQAIANALGAYLQSLGGEIHTSRPIETLADLPSTRAVLLDVTPRQLLRIAGDKLPSGYRRTLRRYRYGPGVCKVDFALDGPIPWTAEACNLAGTVHLGSTLEELRAAEKATWDGEHPDRPFVLLAQQSLFDSTRAPEGKHTVWAYCHTPHGSDRDMTTQVENQIERYAPGFRDRILHKHTFTAVAMEQYNPNYVGGDINGGVQDLRQQYTRPAVRLVPYTTPVPGLFLCSSSTPPGGGVHGMCGFYAAEAALKTL